jgi:hypothetical protein
MAVVRPARREALADVGQAPEPVGPQEGRRPADEDVGGGRRELEGRRRAPPHPDGHDPRMVRGLHVAHVVADVVDVRPRRDPEPTECLQEGGGVGLMVRGVLVADQHVVGDAEQPRDLLGVGARGGRDDPDAVPRHRQGRGHLVGRDAPGKRAERPDQVHVGGHEVPLLGLAQRREGGRVDEGHVEVEQEGLGHGVRRPPRHPRQGHAPGRRPRVACRRAAWRHPQDTRRTTFGPTRRASARQAIGVP